MREQNLYRCRQWLKKKYEEEGLSVTEIARICNVDYNAIYYRLKKYGIDMKKNDVEMKRATFYIPYYFLECLRGFSKAKNQSIGLIISTVMTEHMLQNKYNPFSNREFKEKNG